MKKILGLFPWLQFWRFCFPHAERATSAVMFSRSLRDRFADGRPIVFKGERRQRGGFSERAAKIIPGGNASVTGTPDAMRADFIGAKSGVRYKYGYNGGKENVTLELYEFDLSGLNDTAKKVGSQSEEQRSVYLNGAEGERRAFRQRKVSESTCRDTATDDANNSYVKRIKTLVQEFKK